MTLWMSKSVHWIQRYSDICFEVSWFVQSQLIWPHDWIGLEKLPQNDPLNVKIRPLDPKIQWYLFLSQLICTVIVDLTSQLDWPQKTTPKWPFECQNPSTGSKDTVIFILKSADLYSHSWFDLTIGLALKIYPKMTLCTLDVQIHPLFECQNLSCGSKDTVIFIFKSADLYTHSWCDLTIGLALTQNDPLNETCHPSSIRHPSVILMDNCTTHKAGYIYILYTPSFVGRRIYLITLYIHLALWVVQLSIKMTDGWRMTYIGLVFLNRIATSQYAVIS